MDLNRTMKKCGYFIFQRCHLYLQLCYLNTKYTRRSVHNISQVMIGSLTLIDLNRQSDVSVIGVTQSRDYCVPTKGAIV